MLLTSLWFWNSYTFLTETSPLCQEMTCPWIQACTVRDTGPSCMCKSYQRNYDDSESLICMKSPPGSSKNHTSSLEIYYYMNRCLSDDLCAVPARENDITKSRDFNYFGGCTGIFVLFFKKLFHYYNFHNQSNWLAPLYVRQ